MGHFVVLVYNKTCQKCQNFWPTWQQIKSEMKNKIAIMDISIQEYPEVVETLGVADFPTILQVKDGISQMYKGSLDYYEIINFINAGVVIKNGTF